MLSNKYTILLLLRIGAYLKVKEKKWGGALEHIIGGSIQSFCVNTPEDSRKLFQIMGQVLQNYDLRN